MALRTRLYGDGEGPPQLYMAAAAAGVRPAQQQGQRGQRAQQGQQGLLGLAGAGLALYWRLALRPLQLASAAVALWYPVADLSLTLARTDVSGEAEAALETAILPGSLVRFVRVAVWAELGIQGGEAPLGASLCRATACWLLSFVHGHETFPAIARSVGSINWAAAPFCRAAITPALAWRLSGLAVLGALLPACWASPANLFSGGLGCLLAHLCSDWWAAARWPVAALLSLRRKEGRARAAALLRPIGQLLGSLADFLGRAGSVLVGACRPA